MYPLWGATPKKKENKEEKKNKTGRLLPYQKETFSFEESVGCWKAEDGRDYCKVYIYFRCARGGSSSNKPRKISSK